MPADRLRGTDLCARLYCNTSRQFTDLRARLCSNISRQFSVVACTGKWVARQEPGGDKSFQAQVIVSQPLGAPSPSVTLPARYTYPITYIRPQQADCLTSQASRPVTVLQACSWDVISVVREAILQVIINRYRWMSVLYDEFMYLSIVVGLQKQTTAQTNKANTLNDDTDKRKQKKKKK